MSRDEQVRQSVDCPACAEENGGWRCTSGDGCIIEEAFGPTDSEKRRQEARSAARVVHVPRFAYPLLKRTLLRDRIIYATFYGRVVRVGLRRG